MSAWNIEQFPDLIIAVEIVKIIEFYYLERFSNNKFIYENFRPICELSRWEQKKSFVQSRSTSNVLVPSHARNENWLWLFPQFKLVVITACFLSLSKSESFCFSFHFNPLTMTVEVRGMEWSFQLFRLVFQPLNSKTLSMLMMRMDDGSFSNG